MLADPACVPDKERLKLSGGHIGIETVVTSLAEAVDGTRGRWRPEDLNLFLENLKNTLLIDPDRVYLTGNSMGGYGSWAWGGSNPEHFAAVAPVSGGLGSVGGSASILSSMAPLVWNLKL